MTRGPDILPRATNLARVPVGTRVENLTGTRFGTVEVISRVEAPANYKGRNVFWLVKCDCGNDRVTRTNALKKLRMPKCPGCPFRTKACKHGFSKYKERATWISMRNRCGNPEHKQYKHYGGRGIIVCDGWINSFESFLSDMGKKPSPAHSIDRIDNDKGYLCGHCDQCRRQGLEKTNCRWATQDVQNRNRRTSVNVTIDGVEMCISDAAAHIGVARGTVYRRMWEGASPEEALRVSDRQSPLRPMRVVISE